MTARLCALGIWLLLIAAVSSAANPAGEKRPVAKPSEQPSVLSDKPRPPVACNSESCKAPTPALATPAAKSATAPAVKPVSADAAYEQIRQSREEAILAELNKPIELDFVDTPLDDVLETLRLKLGIQIVCDTDTASTAILQQNPTVTLKVNGISGRSALDLILEPHGLGWDVRREVLWIGSQDRVAKRTETRVYDVTDLVGLQAGDAEKGLSSLIDVITFAVEPSAWGPRGGAGAVEGITVPGTTLIVVNQSRAVQAEVVKLLAELRQIRGSTTPAAPNAPRK
jgi:hypothetical protein